MLSRSQRLQIAAMSSVDERSIKRMYGGMPVRQATRSRVEWAASALGLEMPQSAQAGARSIEMEVVAVRVREEAKRLQPLLPGVDPHDLQLILGRRLRPWGSGQRLFVRRSPDGHYVF